jgi:hypothetical protein
MDKNEGTASLVRSDALLAECLLLLRRMEHSELCLAWSGHRCDCAVPSLVYRITKQLKANAPNHARSEAE